MLHSFYLAGDNMMRVIPLLRNKDMCFFLPSLCVNGRKNIVGCFFVVFWLQLRWKCFRWGRVVPAEEVGEKNNWRADAFTEHAT